MRGFSAHHPWQHPRYGEICSCLCPGLEDWLPWCYWVARDHEEEVSILLHLQDQRERLLKKRLLLFPWDCWSVTHFLALRCTRQITSVPFCSALAFLLGMKQLAFWSQTIVQQMAA